MRESSIEKSTTENGDLPTGCILAPENDIQLEVLCGGNKATLYLSRLRQGSKGACVYFNDSWLTPNEFQYVSGRETAKDWKRSIKHYGKSLKLLMTRGILRTEPPRCMCERCETTPVEPGCETAAPPSEDSHMESADETPDEDEKSSVHEEHKEEHEKNTSQNAVSLVPTGYSHMLEPTTNHVMVAHHLTNRILPEGNTAEEIVSKKKRKKVSLEANVPSNESVEAEASPCHSDRSNGYHGMLFPFVGSPGKGKDHDSPMSDTQACADMTSPQRQASLSDCSDLPADNMSQSSHSESQSSRCTGTGEPNIKSEDRLIADDVRDENGYDVDDSNESLLLNPHKEARLTNIIHELRTYKKHLIHSIEEQKKGGNDDKSGGEDTAEVNEHYQSSEEEVKNSTTERTPSPGSADKRTMLVAPTHGVGDTRTILTSPSFIQGLPASNGNRHSFGEIPAKKENSPAPLKDSREQNRYYPSPVRFDSPLAKAILSRTSRYPTVNQSPSASFVPLPPSASFSSTANADSFTSASHSPEQSSSNGQSSSIPKASEYSPKCQAYLSAGSYDSAIKRFVMARHKCSTPIQKSPLVGQNTSCSPNPYLYDQHGVLDLSVKRKQPVKIEYSDKKPRLELDQAEDLSVHREPEAPLDLRIPPRVDETTSKESRPSPVSSRTTPPATSNVKHLQLAFPWQVPSLPFTGYS